MSEPPIRCGWRGMAGDPLYEHYHDTEWGVPERDSRALWEKLVLDGFQAGLSWITILRKRDAFRAAFDGFDPEKIARFGETERAALEAAEAAEVTTMEQAWLQGQIQANGQIDEYDQALLDFLAEEEI